MQVQPRVFTIEVQFSTSGPCNTSLSTSTQDHHSTHTRLGEKHKTVLVMFHVLSHTFMHAQCKTIAVLHHLPLTKKGRATVVADPSSIQQASGYNTSCMHGSLYMYWPSDFLNNAHRDSKHCKHMASLYKHMGKLQMAITLILRHESKLSHVNY